VIDNKRWFDESAQKKKYHTEEETDHDNCQ